jgi:hypothetical protein
MNLGSFSNGEEIQNPGSRSETQIQNPGSRSETQIQNSDTRSETQPSDISLAGRSLGKALDRATIDAVLDDRVCHRDILTGKYLIVSLDDHQLIIETAAAEGQNCGNTLAAEQCFQ